VEGNEDSFSVLGLLESAHGFESCVEVTDVGFQPVRSVRNAWVNEGAKGKAAGFFEAQENVVVDGTHAEDVRLDDSLQVFPAEEKCLRGGIQKKLAVAVEDSFLSVARMMAESLELQSGSEISQQMHMASLYVDAVGLKHLRKPQQAIHRDCREDDALFQKLLQKGIENLWRLLARA